MDFDKMIKAKVNSEPSIAPQGYSERVDALLAGVAAAVQRLARR